jgi:hypothetical protein
MTTESTNATNAASPLGSASSEGLGAALPVATLVEVLPTKLWVDKDWMGTVSIWRQHEGDKPFKFIEIHYNYAHTSNSHQHALAQQILEMLGGGENRA